MAPRRSSVVRSNGPRARSKGSRASAAFNRLTSCLRLAARQRPQVDHRQLRPAVAGGRGDHLHPLAIHRVERRPQRGVTPHHLAERRRDRADVEPPAQIDLCRDVVDRGCPAASDPGTTAAAGRRRAAGGPRTAPLPAPRRFPRSEWPGLREQPAPASRGPPARSAPRAPPPSEPRRACAAASPRRTGRAPGRRPAPPSASARRARRSLSSAPTRSTFSTAAKISASASSAAPCGALSCAASGAATGSMRERARRSTLPLAVSGSSPAARSRRERGPWPPAASATGRPQLGGRRCGQGHDVGHQALVAAAIVAHQHHRLAHARLADERRLDLPSSMRKPRILT